MSHKRSNTLKNVQHRCKHGCKVFVQNVEIVLDPKNKSEVPRVYFLMMKKKIDWDKSKKGLLNSINAISQTIILGKRI